MKGQWIIIGISGVTCGGKTMLAKNLKEKLSPVFVFHQDRYFFKDDDPRHVPCVGLDCFHNNYDILGALDMEALYSDILSTMSGVDKSCEQTGKQTNIGTNYLVVEGFTALNYKKLFDLCHLKYYITLEKEACIERRNNRIYDPPDVEGYFEKCVWPEHCKYRDELLKEESVTMIDGRESNLNTLQRVLKDIELKKNCL